MADFFRDCRHGLSALRRSPVFTTVAILSLALGIGASTAIFSLLDRVMFRMMPVGEPGRLVEITRFHPPYGHANMGGFMPDPTHAHGIVQLALSSMATGESRWRRRRRRISVRASMMCW